MKNKEKLTYINDRGESAEFSNSSVYHTNKISGISDIRNAIYSINSMGQDGDTYIGSRIQSRDIELSGSIKTRNKEESLNLRRSLNHILNPQINARLLYEYGDFKRVINCNVDSAPIYIQEPIFQGFTVRFVCHNPFWRETHENLTRIAMWLGLFQFELEIPIDEGIEMGMREPSVFVTVTNKGDVKTGLKMEFKAYGTVVNPILLNVNTREFIKINYTLTAGDIISISTYYGGKEIILKSSGGIPVNAFRYLDPESSYMQLDIGDNLFRYDADENIDALEVSIYHHNQYLGV